MIFFVFAIIAISYIFFLLYDVFCVRRSVNNYLFPIALFGLIVATIWMIVMCRKYLVIHFVSVLAMVIAVVGFAAMMESLFFSLPKGTYVDPAAPRCVYRRKMYALCRHPGVLWYCVFYAMLPIIMPGVETVALCGAFCLGDLVYMLVQDLWSFPKIFSDYQDYKQQVPMIIPTIGSIKTCCMDYRHK